MKITLFVLITISLIYLLFINNKKFKYIYYENFMSTNDFELLKKELNNFNEQLNKSHEKYFYVERYNLKLDSNIITNIIKKYENKIKKLTNNNLIYLANNNPIEYRKYTKGSFMNKHKDIQLYEIPQYECLFTISNSTDSVTNFEGDKIQSKPNSLIILKANGVEHSVSKTNYGERFFLKFIFTQTNKLI